MPEDDHLISRREVAAYCGISVGCLNHRARTGQEPRFVRLSPSLTRYRRSDVEAWLRAREWL